MLAALKNLRDFLEAKERSFIGGMSELKATDTRLDGKELAPTLKAARISVFSSRDILIKLRHTNPLWRQIPEIVEELIEVCLPTIAFVFVGF